MKGYLAVIDLSERDEPGVVIVDQGLNKVMYVGNDVGEMRKYNFDTLIINERVYKQRGKVETNS